MCPISFETYHDMNRDMPSRGLKLIGVRFYPYDGTCMGDVRKAKCIQKSLYGRTDWFYFNKGFEIIENKNGDVEKIYHMKSILLNYSQPMRQCSPHSYHYDNDENLNVITDDNGFVLPFVESGLEKLCINTKTEALKEADDTANELLLISTKTKQEMESDDAGPVIYK